MLEEREITNYSLGSIPSGSLRLENQQGFSESVLSYTLIIFTYFLVVWSLLVEPFPVPDFSERSGFTEVPAIGENYSSKFINILNEEDLSGRLKDTVYTDKDCWLELRIDQQMLYQHWRDGRVERYPVSTGNKYLEKGIESRPGLFAIFHKEEHHESTQFNNADMYFFMPFNMGIGFHSLNGTGYYGTLGVAPSSHGCIRMRHQDVRKLFKECPLGTLVLAHRGSTARTVGFAPPGYVNPVSYSKDEMKYLLAENLYNILEGQYFIKERRFLVVDPKVIPTSGIYIGYDRKIPEKQKLPKSTYYYASITDRTNLYKQRAFYSFEHIISNDSVVTNQPDNVISDELSDTQRDLIKKYFHNPIGILPYFPPDK
ncbi:MAG: L,D-transpeptidase family protein [Ignavibacteria bacterium]